MEPRDPLCPWDPWDPFSNVSPMGLMASMGPMGPTGPMGTTRTMGLRGPMGPWGPMGLWGPMGPLGPRPMVNVYAVLFCIRTEQGVNFFFSETRHKKHKQVNTIKKRIINKYSCARNKEKHDIDQFVIIQFNKTPCNENNETKL